MDERKEGSIKANRTWDLEPTESVRHAPVGRSALWLADRKVKQCHVFGQCSFPQRELGKGCELRRLRT
jgi:hypothetical protein